LTCAKEEVKDIEMFDAASAESKVVMTNILSYCNVKYQISDIMVIP
jgi:hypothetical protein